MTDAARLSDLLHHIDGRGYKAYKDLHGHFELPGATLFVDRVQSDPFAAPSRLRVRVPMERAKLPGDLFASRVRHMALADFLARSVRRSLEGEGRGPSRRRGRPGEGSGKSGLVSIDAGGQEVLERTAIVLESEWVEARLEVGLPAAGRRVLGRAAEELLVHRLPAIAQAALHWESIDVEGAVEHVECVESQEAIREQLAGMGLVAFVGNGAVLPRESGASDRPMRGGDAVPFQSPASFEVIVELPNPVSGQAGAGRTMRGMGVPEGVTLIVGGGYHGKSTVLDALERSVYPHIPGDGREWVVARRDLVKVRAEDGRYVAGVDIRPFIESLPGGRDTAAFSTEDSSGSTSQAAGILESIEAGARGLLLDEDTSATNFMLRDARMQALVHKRDEPITPFIDRVRDLHERAGVSSILVMGGCGDYFDVADQVLGMRDYRAFDLTDEARAIAKAHPTQRVQEVAAPLSPPAGRVPLPASIDPSRGRRDVKISARGRDVLQFGTENIDLRAVTQLVDASQTRAVGHAIYQSWERTLDGDVTLAEMLDALEAFLDEEGLDALDPFGRPGRHPGNFARPRRYEVAAALNRLRTLKVR